jgi:hypothetical protein|tara:strand:+ start:124 stop:507 length:384 start_codon:yes stop_codon:yes gene_type:complete
MAKPATKSMISDKDGNSADASKITMPKNRDFRGAWTLEGDVMKEDLSAAKELFKSKIKEARTPLLASEDVAFMMALENDDASARAASVAKKKALRDATKASAIDAASSIKELTAAWDTSVLGDSPYA